MSPVRTRSNAPLPALLTPEEAGRTLAIGRRKLWELTNCGELPCVRIGRAVRYDPEDLRAWIERRKSRGPRR